MNNEFNIIGLYNHNADSYRNVRNSFESSDVVGIVHATGTGKSYNALQLAYDNKDKKIIYVVPSTGIIEHLYKIISDNPNLDFSRDFSNLEFRTYQSFINMNDDEFSKLDCDLLILDEFHHIGAPIWGQRINTMIETHPDMKVFGMTAYTIRDRGTIYERNMANPDTDELFSNKIVSRYDLCDAMIDGVLPKPIYKSAYTNLIGLESKLEEKVLKLNASSREYQEYMAILNDAKKRIQEAPSIFDIMKKNIKPNGKYIYFCPPNSEDGVNDIETIKKQVYEWFRKFVPEDNIVFYTTTSDMGLEGKNNRESFYNDITIDGEDTSNKLRVMFAINQYNEGIHSPNIDGVIMGRGTTSDIVYFEQLGRALSVRGNTKEKFDELEKYSYDELKKLCLDKDISVKNNYTKEDLIEKLISPIVIDLTNNFEFIKNLEDNLKDRIKEISESGMDKMNRLKIRDASFDLEILNQDLFEMLSELRDKLFYSWDDWFELAKIYYEYHGNLKIPVDFKTYNGCDYDEKGIALGKWICRNRVAYKGKGTNKITEEQIKKLESVGMVWNVYDEGRNKNFELASSYYEHYGNLNIRVDFKTSNGYDYDEKGIALGKWIVDQRQAYKGTGSCKITEEQIKKLECIGMVWSPYDEEWNKNFELAKIYYEYHGNLKISRDFRTVDGYTKDENGVALGGWIHSQRNAYKDQLKRKITEEQIKKLESIGMLWNPCDDDWNKNFELAKLYYEHHGNLRICQCFRTSDGYTKDENGVALGRWIDHQRQAYRRIKTYKITEEQIKKLDSIGMVWFTDKTDDKLQSEEITFNNLLSKKKEILNRFYSLLNQFDGDTLPSKEELGNSFVKKLNRK